MPDEPDINVQQNIETISGEQVEVVGEKIIVNNNHHHYYLLTDPRVLDALQNDALLSTAMLAEATETDKRQLYRLRKKGIIPDSEVTRRYVSDKPAEDQKSAPLYYTPTAADYARLGRDMLELSGATYNKLRQVIDAALEQNNGNPEEALVTLRQASDDPEDFEAFHQRVVTTNGMDGL